MCTAISWKPGHHYFGRNLDLHCSFHESVCIVPRRFPLPYVSQDQPHYAMIGIATVADGQPLFYDAVNEMGLAMAGLNFPKSAYYPHAASVREPLPPYALMGTLLAGCADVSQALQLLRRYSLARIDFSSQLPASPLHWLLCDRERCVALEPTAQGMQIWEDPVGVLTNEPPLPYHFYRLSELQQLQPGKPENRICPGYTPECFSLGLGAVGLPGDLSSSSRFVRAAFTRCNARAGKTEEENVGRFFHILDTVAQTDGCTQVSDGWEKTLYSSCCDTDLGIYYYTTWENRQLSAVHLYHEDLNGRELIRYPLIHQQQIRTEN